MTTPQTETGLLTDERFLANLRERFEQAAGAGLSFAVVACVAQHLPGEGVAEVVEVASGCLRGLIRDDDLAGLLNDEVLVAGLADVDSVRARVLADRLQGDLRLRSYHLRSTIWETGVAHLPEDGSSAEELLASAIDAARNRRRRLAG